MTVLALAAYASDETPSGSLANLDDYLNMSGYQDKFSVAEQIAEDRSFKRGSASDKGMT